MNILYGVQTTGNGHVVRSQAMIRELQELGHEVHVILSGCSKRKVIDILSFPSFEKKDGLTFVVEKGRLRYVKTALQLNVINFFRDIQKYEASNYDLVITDYEPITARIARKNKITSIGIGHLYAFSYQVPMTEKSPLSKWIMNNYAPVDYPLGLHWHHFDQPILPPTIPEDVRSIKSQRKNEPFFLVYLPFEEPGDIIPELEKLKTCSFRVYTNTKRPAERENLTMLPYSRRGFIADLAACSGVICNTGFSCISEALYLGKKILTKPVKGQIEQQSNALTLERLDQGTVTSRIDSGTIESWAAAPATKPRQFVNLIPLVAGWIDSGSYGDHRELLKMAWDHHPASTARGYTLN